MSEKEDLIHDMQESLELAMAIIERQHGYLVANGIDPKTGEAMVTILTYDQPRIIQAP